MYLESFQTGWLDNVPRICSSDFSVFAMSCHACTYYTMSTIMCSNCFCLLGPWKWKMTYCVKYHWLPANSKDPKKNVIPKEYSSNTFFIKLKLEGRLELKDNPPIKLAFGKGSNLRLAPTWSLQTVHLTGGWGILQVLAIKHEASP